MQLASLTDAQRAILTRFTEAGGVLEFCLVNSRKQADDPTVHQLAVIFALQIIQRQAQAYALQTAAEHDLPLTDFFQVQIDEEAAEKLVPQRISWTDFLGSRYDHERQGLVVRGKGGFLNEFFFYSDPPERDCVVNARYIDDGIGNGLAYAFSSPPYGMQLDAEEQGALLAQLLQEVLQGTPESIIYAWPTDWSNFFDAGKEWWGSFLWSLSNPKCDRVAVIAASATD